MAQQEMSAVQPTREYYRNLFLEANVSRTGYVSFQEFVNILRKKGYKEESEATLRGYFNKIDTSGDNKLSLPEFLKLMDVIPAIDHRSAMMRYTFRKFDENGDGKIDRDELDQAFITFGIDMDSEEIDRIIAAADKDGSGAIDYEAFVDLMFSP